MPRRKTRTCTIGTDPARQVRIGSEHLVAIQTMTMSKTHDVDAVVAEVESLEPGVCDLIRVAVPDLQAARAIPELKKRIDMPVVADIHFDVRMATVAMDFGADKIRINPGTFLDQDYLKKVIAQAKEKNIAMRIGVNAGSLEKALWKKYAAPSAEALAESARSWTRFVENQDFGNFCVSIKSERVPVMIEAYERFAADGNDVPLHLGVTHAGTFLPGTVKNSIGIGALLARGIGDTVRASITDSIAKEVEVCKTILKSLGLYNKEPDIIACPTCGRIEVDLPKMVAEVETALKGLKKPVRVSVMGCVVNGPGEAKESDFGIACGKHAGALYYKGELHKPNIPEKELVPELLKLIEEKA